MDGMKHTLHFKIDDAIALSGMTEHDVQSLYRKINKFKDVCDELGIKVAVSIYDGEMCSHELTAADAVAACICTDATPSVCCHGPLNKAGLTKAQPKTRAANLHAARLNALKNITEIQYACLEVIESNPGIAAQDISQQSEFKAVSDARLAYPQINALVARGLVIKEQKDVNGRATLVCNITRSGSAELIERRRYSKMWPACGDG